MKRNKKELDVSFNKVGSLSKNFTSLKSLEVLRAQNINLSSLIPLGNLSKLRILDLRFNSLTDLPNDIQQLDSTLSEIHLENNLFQKLPSSLSTLTKLKYLQFSGNPFPPARSTMYRRALDAGLPFLLEYVSSTDDVYSPPADLSLLSSRVASLFSSEGLKSNPIQSNPSTE